jgi:CheY-like chemotaxis protein
MLCGDHDLGGVRVFVIDDRADDRELWSIVLEGCGAEVAVAESVADVLAAFDRVRPDVLVSDIDLPDGDGYALLRRLRAAGSRVPAIAVTAYARAQDVAAAAAAGFTMHLAKPVEPETLVAAVAQLTRPNQAAEPDRAERPAS